VLTAYGVFANGGFRRRPVTITSVVDGRRHLLEDNGVFFDGASSASSVVYRAFNRLRVDESPVIRPSTAYLMTYVLHDVIEMGTGYGATELDAPAAGKTGTTNAYDGWFVGYTERLNSVIWVGSDRNTRPLGHGEHGSEVALPIWLSFMKSALEGLEQASLTEPRPHEIELVKVDLYTGRRVLDTEPGVWLPFRVGTVPTVYGPSSETLDLMQLEQVERLF
jgi:penicillin-binding protein 1A